MLSVVTHLRDVERSRASRLSRSWWWRRIHDHYHPGRANPAAARRLIEMVRHGRLDLRPLLTHRFALENIGEAYRLFGERRNGVMKVAITP